jgi:hypothetical protein
MQGRVIRTLVDRVQERGMHTVTWDRKDDVGHLTACGVYVSRLSADDSSDSKRLVLTD